MRDLALHAANETNDADAVAADQQEIHDAIDQLNRIAGQTSFGTRKLLNGDSGVSGSATASDVAFLSGTTKTKTGAYAVEISQVAVKAEIQSRGSMTVANAVGATGVLSTGGATLTTVETTLTIAGTGIGTGSVSLTIAAGSDVAAVASAINNDSTLAAEGITAAVSSAGTLSVSTSFLSSGGAAGLTVSATDGSTGGAGSDLAGITGIATGGTAAGTAAAGLDTTLATDEALTFTNGASAITVNLKAGTRLGVAVGEINVALEKAGFQMEASLDLTNQVFKLANTEFGSSTTVANMVTSDQAGSGSTLNLLAAANTAFNIANAGSSGTVGVAGKDVKGTLNGEAATGTGNKLAGDAGNANTDGLTITYSGGTTGLAGTVTVQNNTLTLQIGAFAGETSMLQIDEMSADKLGMAATGLTTLSGKDINVSKIDLTTKEGAQDAIRILDAAIAQVSGTRAKIGAVQSNVLEAAVRNLGVAKTNMSATESTIRDLDFASEILSFSRSQILQQSGFAMVAQTNQAQQLVLGLLQG